MILTMENDEFRIPEQYRKMSVTQLDEEARKLYENIKSKPRTIREKKKVAQGKKDILFHI